MLLALSFSQAVDTADNSDEIEGIREYYKKHHTQHYFIDALDEIFYFNDKSLVWITRTGDRSAHIVAIGPDDSLAYMKQKESELNREPT